MKTSHNKKAKLTLEKLQITKLDNPNSIKGGQPARGASDTFGDMCTKSDINVIA